MLTCAKDEFRRGATLPNLKSFSNGATTAERHSAPARR